MQNEEEKKQENDQNAEQKSAVDQTKDDNTNDASDKRQPATEEASNVGQGPAVEDL